MIPPRPTPTPRSGAPPKLRDRVLGHIVRYDRGSLMEPVPWELTQSGMVRVFSIPQNTLSKTLTSLEAAGLIIKEKPVHVKGSVRRMSYYRATPLGRMVVQGRQQDPGSESV